MCLCVRLGTFLQGEATDSARGGGQAGSAGVLRRGRPSPHRPVVQVSINTHRVYSLRDWFLLKFLLKNMFKIVQCGVQLRKIYPPVSNKYF